MAPGTSAPVALGSYCPSGHARRLLPPPDGMSLCLPGTSLVVQKPARASLRVLDLIRDDLEGRYQRGVDMLTEAQGGLILGHPVQIVPVTRGFELHEDVPRDQDRQLPELLALKMHGGHVS